MTPFIGQISMFGGNFAPRGWADCDGQLLPISQNTALFSILGTTYGGDGRTTFGLPDMRGRIPLHAGTGAGLSPRRQGDRYGSEENTLNTNQLASHNHTISSGKLKIKVAQSCGADTKDPSAGILGMATSEYYTSKGPDSSYNGGDGGGITGEIKTANSGSNQPVNNIMPYNVVRFVIALEGTYPSRS